MRKIIHNEKFLCWAPKQHIKGGIVTCGDEDAISNARAWSLALSASSKWQFTCLQNLTRLLGDLGHSLNGDTDSYEDCFMKHFFLLLWKKLKNKNRFWSFINARDGSTLRVLAQPSLLILHHCLPRHSKFLNKSMVKKD